MKEVVLLNIFVGTVIKWVFFVCFFFDDDDYLMNSRFKRTALEIEILSNIMNVLGVTFKEFNVSLNRRKKKLLNSSVWLKSSATRSLFHWEGIIQTAFVKGITWFIHSTVHSWIWNCCFSHELLMSSGKWQDFQWTVVCLLHKAITWFQMENLKYSAWASCHGECSVATDDMHPRLQQRARTRHMLNVLFSSNVAEEKLRNCWCFIS